MAPRKPRHFRFTEARLRNADAPRRGRITYLDDDCPGLALRVSATGVRSLYSKLWQPESAEWVWKRIARVGGIGLDEARNRVRRLGGVMAHGADLYADRAAAREDPTLGDLVESYRAMRERRGDRSAQNEYEQLWQRWLGRLPDLPPRKHGRKRVKPPAAVDWSERHASSITHDEVNRLVGKMGETRITGRVVGFLRAAYEWGCDPKSAIGLKVNPALRVAAPKSRKRKTIVRTDQLGALFEAIGKTAQPWRDLFTLLVFIGYRRAAVQAMRWRDIDFSGEQWIVPATGSKNKEATPLPLTGAALTVLKRRHKKRGESAYVFPGATAAGHLGRPKRQWQALLERAGIDDLWLHDLRRTLGSHMVSSGVELPIVAKALGHKDVGSTAVYAHVDIESARSALKRTHRVIDEARRRK